MRAHFCHAINAHSAGLVPKAPSGPIELIIGHYYEIEVSAFWSWRYTL